MHKIRKAVLAVSFAALFILAGTAAHASCPTITVYNGYTTWNQFDVDSSCLTSSGASAVSVSWCYPMYVSGYSYDMGWDNHTTWSFTVPADDPYTGYARKANWSVSTPVTFSSPTSSVYDNIRGYVQVTHNGYTTTSNWFYIYGGGSSTQYCNNQSGSFSAATGDTITLIIESTRLDSNAVTQAGIPTIVNY